MWAYPNREMFARVSATANAGAYCFANVANPFICSILACYKIFEKEFKAVEANAMVKQEQVKVLTSEVAKYQQHLMLEKGKGKERLGRIVAMEAQLEEYAKLAVLQEARFIALKETIAYSPGSPEAKFAAKSPLVTSKNGCPTPFSPAHQEEPGVEDEGSETDEDVDDDFNYQKLYST